MVELALRVRRFGVNPIQPRGAGQCHELESTERRSLRMGEVARSLAVDRAEAAAVHDQHELTGADMRKRWLAWAFALLLVLVFLAIAIPVLLPPTPGVNYANLSRIERGMTRAQ